MIRIQLTRRCTIVTKKSSSSSSLSSSSTLLFGSRQQHEQNQQMILKALAMSTTTSFSEQSSSILSPNGNGIIPPPPPLRMSFNSNNNSNSNSSNSSKNSTVMKFNEQQFELPVRHSSKSTVMNTPICYDSNELRQLTLYIITTPVGNLFKYNDDYTKLPVRKIQSKAVQQLVALNDRYIAWTDPNLYTIIQLTEYVLRSYSSRIPNTIWNRYLGKHVIEQDNIVSTVDGITKTIKLMEQLIYRLEQEGCYYMEKRNNYYEQTYGISPIKPPVPAPVPTPTPVPESSSNESTVTTLSSSNYDEVDDDDDDDDFENDTNDGTFFDFDKYLKVYDWDNDTDEFIAYYDNDIDDFVTIEGLDNVRQFKEDFKAKYPADYKEKFASLFTALLEDNTDQEDDYNDDDNNSNTSTNNNQTNTYNVLDDIYGQLRKMTNISSTDNFDNLVLELQGKKMKSNLFLGTGNDNTNDTNDADTPSIDRSSIATKGKGQKDKILFDSQDWYKELQALEVSVKRQQLLNKVVKRMKKLQRQVETKYGKKAAADATDGIGLSDDNSKNNNTTTTTTNYNDIKFIDPTKFKSSYVYDFAAPGPTIAMYDILLDTIACGATLAASTTAGSNKIDTVVAETATVLIEKTRSVQKKALERYVHELNKFSSEQITNYKQNNNILHYIQPTILTFNAPIRTAANQALVFNRGTIIAETDTQMKLRDDCLDLLLSSFFTVTEASEPCESPADLFSSVLHPEQEIDDVDKDNNKVMDLLKMDNNSDDEDEDEGEESTFKLEDDEDDEDEDEDDYADEEDLVSGPLDGIVRVNTASYLYMLQGFNHLLPPSYIKSNILHGIYRKAKHERVLSEKLIKQYKNMAQKSPHLDTSGAAFTLKILSGQGNVSMPETVKNHWYQKDPLQLLAKYKHRSKQFQYTPKDPTY